MQDRIDELIDQATVKEETYSAGCNGYPEVSFYFDKRKFAELIIKECVDLLKGKQDYYEDPGMYESQSYYDRCEAKANAFGDAVDAIKFHFRG